jgi:hypothetical protein
MNCCARCFKNQEIGIIIEEISTTQGKCDYCNSTDVKVVDAREIVEPFQPVICLYETSPEGKSLLCELLQEDWDIFNLSTEKISSLLKDIFSDEKSLADKIFDLPVINKTHNHQKSEGIIHQWELLKKEIIETNRFFLENVIDLDLLGKYLIDKSINYKIGHLFYRGRISTKDGLPLYQIGKPPLITATAGRANPQGIPYLYLSADKETTVYETRATYLDYVTIGTFRLIEDIKIVKLRTVEIQSPFEEEILEKLLYQPFLKGLEYELSKPLRRFDSELDYLPTQYLCEFIKHLGFDGVEYGSAMKKGGINLAIFNDSKLECFDKEIIEVKDIKISF